MTHGHGRLLPLTNTFFFYFSLPFFSLFFSFSPFPEDLSSAAYAAALVGPAVSSWRGWGWPATGAEPVEVEEGAAGKEEKAAVSCSIGRVGGDRSTARLECRGGHLGGGTGRVGSQVRGGQLGGGKLELGERRRPEKSGSGQPRSSSLLRGSPARLSGGELGDAQGHDSLDRKSVV